MGLHGLPADLRRSGGRDAAQRRSKRRVRALQRRSGRCAHHRRQLADGAARVPQRQRRKAAGEPVAPHRVAAGAKARHGARHLAAGGLALCQRNITAYLAVDQKQLGARRRSALCRDLRSQGRQFQRGERAAHRRRMEKGDARRQRVRLCVGGRCARARHRRRKPDARLSGAGARAARADRRQARHTAVFAGLFVVEHRAHERAAGGHSHQ